MNDIARVASSATFPTQGFEDINPDLTTQLQQQIHADPSKVLKEISSLAGTLQAGMQPSGGNTISNANGAPQISGVSLNFSPEDMAAALLVLQGKTQEAQLNTAKNGIESNTQKQKIQNEKAMGKIQEWIKNCEAAEAKQKTSGILGWFKKAFAVVAAVFAVVAATVATVATGGAAAPLLALAVLSLASSTLSLASEISKANGGKGFDDIAEWMDPSVLMGKAAGAVAKACGADEQQIAIVSSTFAIATTLAIVAASVVLTGGASATASLSKIAQISLRVGQAGQAVTGVATGATEVAQGVVNMEIAGDEKNASLAQSDKKKIDALIAMLQQQMEDGREDLKKVLDEMMDGMNIVSQMINSAGQSQHQITANLSGRNQII